MLLEARSLTKTFDSPAGPVQAVDKVSFSVARGQTLGLVGESGSGKSTVARVLLRLLEPTSGSIFFEQEDVISAKGKELLALRRRMQMVFQDPHSSLLPHLSAADNVAEPLRIHKIGDRASRRQQVSDILDRVGVKPATMNRYPHEFSGGQQQRIAIARAMILHPTLLVCDEPTSSLDVSVQAQIINLLQDMQRQESLTMLFISHNLAVVERLANQVAVMSNGRLVELAPTEELFRNPIHPYTQSLLAALLPLRSNDRAPVTRMARSAVNVIEAPIGWQEIRPGHFVAGHSDGITGSL